MVISEAIMGTFISKLGDKLTSLFDKNRGLTQIVRVKLNPNSFYLSEIDDVTTTSNVFPDILEPNMSFKNPVKRPIIIKEISLLSDNNFKTNGMVEVLANKALIFKSRKIGNFKNISAANVKIEEGKILNRDESVNIYIKNDDGITSINLTVLVTFGEAC